jgi:hypothetical protein
MNGREECQNIGDWIILRWILERERERMKCDVQD